MADDLKTYVHLARHLIATRGSQVDKCAERADNDARTERVITRHYSQISYGDC